MESSFFVRKLLKGHTDYKFSCDYHFGSSVPTLTCLSIPAPKVLSVKDRMVNLDQRGTKYVRSFSRNT